MNLVQGSMSVRDYADKFEELYQYAKDVYPTEEAKSDKFRGGLHVSLKGKLNLYAGTTFRGWVEKAMEQERLDDELEETEQQKEMSEQLANENKRMKFSAGSEKNISSDRCGKPQGSQVSMRQSMALQGQADNVKRQGALWCDECKNHHTGNCSRRTRVRCYQCSEIGHYARDCPERAFAEQSLLESSASHLMR